MQDLWCATLVLIAVLLAGTSCADPAASPPKTVPEELEPLYEMVRGYRGDFENALEHILAGDDETGREMLATASRRISVAAQLCARSPECDMSLFTEALRRTLDDPRDTEPRGLAEGDAPAADPTSPVAEMAPGQSGVSLVDASDLEDPARLNGPVKAAINDWLTWNRPALLEAFVNYRFLRAEVAPIYERAGLPEALLFAMMAKETGVRVHAYSRAGAAGPLQFMPHTGRRYGLGSIRGFDMRLDPVAATRANVAYLADQLRAFDNDLELALAAYNVGEGRLRRLYRKHAGAGFWDPRVYYALPPETRDYVPQVLAAAVLFLHPAEFGLELPDVAGETTSLTLEEDAALGELAICLAQIGNPDGWFRTLRNLNPRRSATRRIAAGESIRVPSAVVRTYAESCLGNTPLARLARALHDASYPAEPESVPFVVRRGDTLAGIAAMHRCWSVHRIAALNGLEGPDYIIYPGQHLAVPECD